MDQKVISDWICETFLLHVMFLLCEIKIHYLPEHYSNRETRAHMDTSTLWIRNSMSLLVFSSILLEATSSSTSCEISGRLLLLPPRLRLDEVEEELRPESGTGDAWPSRRKSTPAEHSRGTGERLEPGHSGCFYFADMQLEMTGENMKGAA